jgi:hypothetical protein
LILHLTRGIQARQQTLGAGFFIARRAVDLAGKVEPGDEFRFKTRFQIARIEEIVLDGVARARDVRVFETGHGLHEGLLHLEGQAGGNAVGVDLVGIQAFGLHEDLVGVLVGKAFHLVFYGGAVARTHAIDGAGEHGRLAHVGANNVVGALIGPGDPAGHLSGMLIGRTDIGENRRRVVAGLFVQLAEIDAAPVDARRRAGLEPAYPKGPGPQLFRQRIGGRIAGTTAFALAAAHMNATTQEGTHGQHDGRGIKTQAHAGDHAADPVILNKQIVHPLLKQGQTGLVFHHGADGLAIEIAVGLGASGTHRRALAGIQGAELDTGPVDRTRHGTTQGVDLAGEVPLADAADGGVAGHLADGVQVLGQQKCPRTGPRRREGRLGAGVTAAHNDDIKTVCTDHTCLPGPKPCHI